MYSCKYKKRKRVKNKFQNTRRLKNKKSRNVNTKIKKNTNTKRWVGGVTNTSSPFELKKDVIEGGGIFCYMPYESLDESQKSIFRIDLAMDVKKEFDNLKRYYPTGFFVIACLLKIKLKTQTEEEYYGLIVDKILKYIMDKGGETQEGYEKGWIYCTEETIHHAFLHAKTKFGGDVKKFELTGRRNDTFKLIDTKITEVPTFVGKVVYHT
jgi:hypothetical protein